MKIWRYVTPSAYSLRGRGDGGGKERAGLAIYYDYAEQIRSVTFLQSFTNR